jgi:hypothetical protein
LFSADSVDGTLIAPMNAAAETTQHAVLRISKPTSAAGLFVTGCDWECRLSADKSEIEICERAGQ